MDLDEYDYEFFSSLPDDEKILFMYDLICANAYNFLDGVEESDEDLGDNDVQFSINPDSFKLADFETIVNSFEGKLREIIASTISPTNDVNMLVINGKVIFNSNDLVKLEASAKEFALSGFILSEFKMDDHMREILTQQKYCKVYTIVGRTQNYSDN